MVSSAVAAFCFNWWRSDHEASVRAWMFLRRYIVFQALEELCGGGITDCAKEKGIDSPEQDLKSEKVFHATESAYLHALRQKFG